MSDTPIDENAGHGGSYLIDDETGIRTLVERTAPAKPDTTEPEPAEPKE